MDELPEDDALSSADREHELDRLELIERRAADRRAAASVPPGPVQVNMGREGAVTVNWSYLGPVVVMMLVGGGGWAYSDLRAQVMVQRSEIEMLKASDVQSSRERATNTQHLQDHDAQFNALGMRLYRIEDTLRSH